MVNIDQIKKLREETGVSVIECQKALKETKGDIEKAKEFLRKKGKELAGKKSSRKVKSGLISTYTHQNKKVGVILDIRCESDFVAKSNDFQKIAHELCLQIAAMSPDQDSLMSQPWIKDQSKTIKDLIEEHIIKLGENIVIKKFVRYEL